MYLIHNILGENNLYDILTDGYLKPSSKTENVKGYGRPEGTKYIFLRLNKRNDIGNLYFSNELLLHCTFYLNIGWHDEITTNTIKINGKTLNQNQLNILLSDYNKKMPIMMTNEIMIKKNISLKKFLVKIANIEINNKTKELLKEKYANIKL